MTAEKLNQPLPIEIASESNTMTTVTNSRTTAKTSENQQAALRASWVLFGDWPEDAEFPMEVCLEVSYDNSDSTFAHDDWIEAVIAVNNGETVCSFQELGSNMRDLTGVFPNRLTAEKAAQELTAPGIEISIYVDDKTEEADDQPVAEQVAPEAVSEANDDADSEPGDDDLPDLPASVIKKLVSELPAAVAKELYAVFERYYAAYKDRDYDEFEVETLDGRETGRAKRGTAEWRKAMGAWTKQRRAAYDFDKIAWYDHLTGERGRWGFSTFLDEIKQEIEDILWTYVTSDLTGEDAERFDEPTPDNFDWVSEYLDWVSEVIENCLDTLDDDFDDDTLDDDFDDSIKGYLCPETCAVRSLPVLPVESRAGHRSWHIPTGRDLSRPGFQS